MKNKLIVGLCALFAAVSVSAQSLGKVRVTSSESDGIEFVNYSVFPTILETLAYWPTSPAPRDVLIEVYTYTFNSVTGKADKTVYSKITASNVTDWDMDVQVPSERDVEREVQFTTFLPGTNTVKGFRTLRWYNTLWQ